MAKALTIGAPRHPATGTAYEQECGEMLVPHLDALLDKVEAAGWDRGQAASAHVSCRDAAEAGLTARPARTAFPRIPRLKLVGNHESAIVSRG